MIMMTDEHFHVDSLNEFTEELEAEGFEPVPDSTPQRWRGRIHPAFISLTDAATMDVVIRPGWPFQSPAVLVEGLSTNHSTLGGYVCMWHDDDPSLEWTTVGGLYSRMEEWCKAAKNGWENDPLDQDAFLNFMRKDPLVATFNLPTLGIHKGGQGEFHAVVNQNPFRLDIVPGRRRPGNQLHGLWFHAGTLKAPPPRQLSEVSDHLNRQQRKALSKALGERRKREPLVVSGGVDIILFCWERHGRTDLLVMACKGTGEDIDAIALQPGPKDEESLTLRAGPDASILRTLNVALFGAGALGGQVAVMLAESGIGRLEMVDPDVLLPGNVVRHIAGHSYVGTPKVDAVRAIIKDHAPWTEVTGHQEWVRTPEQVCRRIVDADVVIDATGNEALTNPLAMVALDLGKPLVAGALYRGGAIGRVQRQSLSGDTPIHQREDHTRYPLIPSGDAGGDFATPQLGCSAPVNNAPPSAVQACASLITQVAMDVLTDSFEFTDEVIDVYRAIPQPPFHKVGRINYEVA